MSVASISTRKSHSVGRVERANPSLLRRHPRLAAMPDAVLDRVARASECQLIPAGYTFFDQDESADAVYLLLDGAISLERRRQDGSVVSHRVVGPDASFGDDALLGVPGRYFGAHSEAVSIIVRTPLALLREVLTADPNLAEAWIHAITADLERRGHRMTSPVCALASPAFPDAA